MSVISKSVVAQLVICQITMSTQKQKILGRFLRLAQPKFSIAPGKDTYKFLITYEDRLYNLGLFETRCMDYTIFQLDLVARPQFSGYMDS